MARCEIFRRYGGAFSLGPVRWEQCPNEATVQGVDPKFPDATVPVCSECVPETVKSVPGVVFKPLEQPTAEGSDAA